MDQNRARMESELGRAHRALHAAKSAAERMESPGDVEDIEMLLKEVTRLAEYSLRDKRRRQIPGQTQMLAGPSGIY